MNLKIYEQAIELCNRGNLSKAKSLLLENIKSEKDIPSDVYRLLAQISMMEGEKDNAINYGIESLKIDSKNIYANILMGNIMLRYKEYDSALKYYEDALAINPNEMIALNNIASINVQKGNLDLAKEYFDKVISVDPSYLNAYYGKATMLLESKNYKEMFNILVTGLKNYAPRPENPTIYEECVKTLINVAKELAAKNDGYRIVAAEKDELSRLYGASLQIEESNELNVTAKLKYGPTYGKDYHKVVYNPQKPYFEHILMHELTHLRMNLAAGPKKNRIIFSTQDQFAEFRKTYASSIKRNIPNIEPSKLHSLLDDICGGISLQVMNCPLDILVEDRLFEDYEDLRPIQFLSLLEMERTNVKSSTEAGKLNLLPKEIVSKNTVMNMVTSMHFKQLYGVDTVQEYKATSKEKSLAEDMYEMYKDYINDREPGEEYDMLLDFSDALDFTKYMSNLTEEEFVNGKNSNASLSGNVSDEELERRRYEDLDEEATERQRKFDEEQSQDDPRRTLMMALLMECALDDFDGWDQQRIKKTAMEIAIRGLKGITPSDESGYSVPSLPGRDFSGYAFLAYYYVSWKLTSPNDIKAIGLQVYDNAWVLAKKKFDKKKGN